MNLSFFKKILMSIFTGCLWFYCGFMLAGLAWGTAFAWHLVILAALPLLWSKAPTRTKSWLLMFGYYLSAASDVPKGGSIFFGADTQALGLAFLLWFSVSFILSLVWMLFWSDFSKIKNDTVYAGFISKRFLNISLRLILIFAVITVPPVGVISGGNPLMGYAWFPFMTGMGFTAILIGIILTAITADYLFRLEENGKHKKNIAVKTGVVAFFAFMFLFGSSPTIEAMNLMASDLLGIKAVATKEGKEYSGSAVSNTAEDVEFILDKYVKNITDKDKVIVLPETIFDTLNNEKTNVIAEYIKNSENSEAVILAGAKKELNKNEYENGIYAFTCQGELPNVHYIQRFPVPVSMWQPWKGGYSCRCDWFGKGVLDIGLKHNAAALICYEHVLAFPVFRSFMHMPFSGDNRPETILAVTNQWWSVDTEIPNIQKQSLLTWCRLFGVPAITADNIGIKAAQQPSADTYKTAREKRRERRDTAKRKTGQL